MSWLTSNLRYKLLALAIALGLWAVAHGSAEVDRVFDIPVRFERVPEGLILTRVSAREVNVRVMGRRAVLRNLVPDEMAYVIDASGLGPGEAEFEVDMTRVELPRGAELLSRSPAEIEVKAERVRSKRVKVRPVVLAGAAEGFRVVGEPRVAPPRVRLRGARSVIERLEWIPTERVEIVGAREPVDRVVALVPPEHVWVDEDVPVHLHLDVQPVPPGEGAHGAAADAASGSRAKGDGA